MTGLSYFAIGCRRPALISCNGTARCRQPRSSAGARTRSGEPVVADWRVEDFVDGFEDLLGADRVHADIVRARTFAVIAGAHAGRAGQPGVNRYRVAERPVEVRRLRAE